MAKQVSGLHRVVFRVSTFFHEVWRRKVVQAAAAYAVASWIAIEVASVVLAAFDAPAVYLQGLIAIVAIGFPIVMVFSWLFDLTARGLVRTEDLESDDATTEEELEIQSVRRQLTVLCAAIEVNQQGASVDPEDLVDVQPRALQLARKICKRFEGHIVPSRAGELLVYFGYPVAQEEATRNAVQAALGLVTGISRFSEGGSVNSTIQLTCRAAVHTGDVIIEESASDEADPDIVGTLPTDAAQVLNRCALGEVLISSAAHRNVRGLFEVEATGDGAADASRREYRVSFESGVRNRLEAQGDEELLPLIGRDVELSQLDQHWRRTLDGSGQVVLMSGGAGMGKSRIVHAFKKSAAENPQAWMWELYCEPMSHDTALHPVTEFIRRAVLGLDETDSATDSLAQLEGFLAEYNQSLTEKVPLMAAMLNVPLNDQYSPPGLSPQRQRQETMQLIIDIVAMRAERQPLLFIVEDLHWADSSSIELFSLLVEQVPAYRIMFVLTYRPPFEVPWRFASHVSMINVAGLDSSAAREVCNSISENIPREVVVQITDRADGVPLFIEEVTKTLVESGAFGDDPDETQMESIIEDLIPSTLKDALTARLDRLGKARSIAQLGATIGRDFSHDLIAEVAREVKARRIDDGLQQLVEPEILMRIGLGTRTSYRFKHALIHDAAYHSLIKKQRRLFHSAIARVLEEHFPDLVENNPEILAHHHEGAGEAGTAINYRLKAASQAMFSAASAEALSHLHSGIGLLRQIDNGSERDLLELSLQTTLGSASMFAYGYASPEAHDAYSKAEALCGPDVPPQNAVPVVMGLSAYHSVRGAAQDGQKQNRRILEMAELTQDDDLLLWAHAFVCVGNFYEGHFEDSRRHLDEVIRLYDFDKHKYVSAATSQDPKVFAMLHAAQACWALGREDEALRLAVEKDELAKKLGHPLVLQQALGWGNVVYLYAGKPEQLVEKAREAHAIATEQDIPFYIGGNLVWWGAGLAERGDHETGIDKMRQGLAILQDTGAQIGRPLMLTLVARSLGAVGRPEEGLREIETALQQVERWGERFYLSETLRTSGELKVELGRAADARQDFERALEVARQQNAASFESKVQRTLDGMQGGAN